MIIGAFDFKQRCIEWSVYYIKYRESIREQVVPMLSNGSRSTLMSYTDHSMQRCLKSNAPNTMARVSLTNAEARC